MDLTGDQFLDARNTTDQILYLNQTYFGCGDQKALRYDSH